MMSVFGKEFWNFKAGCYDTVRRLPILRRIYQTELDRLRALIPARPFATHLDVGTGTGSSLKIFAPASLRVLSDRSPAMLRHAAHRFRQPGILCDLERNLPFCDSAFELITAIGVMEYIADFEHVLKELHRVAAPNGCLLMTTSPPGLFTTLRALSGNRPHAHRPQAVREMIRQAGWQEVEHHHSSSQDQWLCRKQG